MGVCASSSSELEGRTDGTIATGKTEPAGDGVSEARSRVRWGNTNAEGKCRPFRAKATRRQERGENNPKGFPAAHAAGTPYSFCAATLSTK